MKTLLFFTILTVIKSIADSLESSTFDSLYSRIDVRNEYSLVNKTVTNNSFKLILKNSENQHQARYFKKGKVSDKYLTLEIFLMSKTEIQFIFRDLFEQSFEMPKEEPFPFHKYEKNLNDIFHSNNVDYEYELSILENPFSFSVLRKNTSEVIFSTVGMDIVFKRNYAEISTIITSENLFGLGERTMNFKVPSGTYTMYNKDIYGELEDGKGTGKQRYGSHPMYLMREKSANYHINYLRNSLPMNVIVDHENSMLTYKVAGGVLDFTIFLGDKNPETAIKMYHKFLGGYSMHPFWSFGFHQSRWGYKNLEMVEEVLTLYKSLNIPLDVIWNDIDYMIDHMSFTVDTQSYNIQDFKDMLKYFKKKYVMISEPTIGIKWENFPYYKKGLELDIFIKNGRGENLINRVWPGRCHFIDFFNPNSKTFWEEAMSDLHKNLTYDGVWLDMNEIAAFEAGQVSKDDYKIPCEDHENYSYIPGEEPFETKTICPNAVHHKGMKHIQVHNYYPNMQAKRTYEFLEKLHPDQFPFVLTRANAPGIGKYAAHWSGDNYGRFSFYRFSITEIFNFNLFGAPMTGADICGFGEDTPEVLCSKWYQIGALYPFSRSHAHIDSYRKEPFAMGKTLYETTLKSLRFRYSILKYYYSLFMLNNGVGTIFRPLFFEFYDDPALLEEKNIQNYFIIGSSLLVVPNFNELDLSYSTAAYFPKGDWFDLRHHKRVEKKSNNPESVTITNKLKDMPPVFLRSGNILFVNDITHVGNTEDLDNKFKLIMSFNSFDKEKEIKKSYANGIIPALTNYHSKHRIENCMKKSCYVHINSELNFNSNELKLSFSKAKFYEKDYTYLEITELLLLGINLPNAGNSKIKSYIEQHTEKFLKSASEDYDIQVKNEDCISIKFKESIKLKREGLSFTFKLD
jgi:alpha-glucosidase (family GH31 glycosyl hydrolase)